MKQFLFNCGTRDHTASFGIFLFRVMIGLMMLVGHGIPKIEKFATLKEKFYIPDFFPFAYMSSAVSLSACIAAEVGAAALIILGLATRPAAFILGFTMVVAAFGTHGGADWFGGGKEMAILYLISMIGIILTGAGSISIDSRLYKEGRRLRMII